MTLVSLYRTLRRIRPTITHVSTPKAALLGSIAAWLARVPIPVFLVRGLITENARGPRRRLFRWLERLTSRLSHATICVAPSLLEFARAEGIVGPGLGTVMANGMSNGIDPRRFGPVAVKPAAVSWGDSADTSDMAAPVVMGFVGRLTRDKGVEEIAAAWQSTRTEFPNARLLLVGPWEHEDPVSETARRSLESDPRVLLVGRVADTAPYYKVMDLFLFPSQGTEGFPNAPMEAACMGLPVIASRVVGCVDAVVDGVTGMLVPPRNASALAGAIRTYLRDPDLRRRHGRTGRERVLRDFRQDVIWEALYQEYVRLLREKGLPFPEGPLQSAESADTAESRRPSSTIGDSLEETKLTQEDLAQSWPDALSGSST